MIGWKQVKRFLRDAVVSFAFWTGTLTPYMLLVVQVDMSQYLAWIGMQALIVPPLGALSAVLFRWVDKKWRVD